MSKVTLSSFEEENIYVLHKLLNEYSNQVLVGGTPTPKTLLEVKTWLLNKTNTSNVCFFSVNYENICQGYIQLVDIDYLNGVATMGINLLSESRGKGIGKQALVLLHNYARDILLLRKIILRVYARNSNAINLYKQLDYEVVGTLHQHIRLVDGYDDVKLMEKFL